MRLTWVSGAVVVAIVPGAGCGGAESLARVQLAKAAMPEAKKSENRPFENRDISTDVLV